MAALVITGSSRGIGAATAILAAQEGHNICLTCLDDYEAVEETAHKVSSLGVKVMVRQFDVADAEASAKLFNDVTEEFGGVSGLVNNAAILGPVTTFAELGFADLKRVFETNVYGCFNCAKEAVLRMSLKNGGQGGAIVNVSSVIAKFGAPGEYVHYAATKGAVEAMTIGLASEVADQGIRVNAVRPGLTKTTMFIINGDNERINRVAPTIPMRRAGEPNEIAEAIYWLFSDKASYVTGAILDVGGGR